MKTGSDHIPVIACWEASVVKNVTYIYNSIAFKVLCKIKFYLYKTLKAIKLEIPFFIYIILLAIKIINSFEEHINRKVSNSPPLYPVKKAGYQIP